MVFNKEIEIETHFKSYMLSSRLFFYFIALFAAASLRQHNANTPDDKSNMQLMCLITQ